ncbi:MAG TPA: (2Fe-2S)-binding protein [Candidatus Acidoferrales bacterium]|nr:(2Fe-2S)-binding protein [Candidatus Acidoferrales bacterium]
MARVSELNVNGTRHTVDVDAETTLLSVLRDQLDLTGTKYGCGEGQCAACTVLIDGNPRHSCQVKVGSVGQRQITTIEGLEKNGELHPVQQAFIDADAMQCAYCTPGMVLGGVALLKSNPNPTEEQIIEYMNGHLCRCGVYQRIVEAIALAAKRMKAGAA